MRKIVLDEQYDTVEIILFQVDFTRPQIWPTLKYLTCPSVLYKEEVRKYFQIDWC